MSHSETKISTEHCEDDFFLMPEILFAGTIMFSGCSRIKLNLGKELNVTSSLPRFIEYFTGLIEYFVIIHLVDRLKGTLIKFLVIQY